MSEPQRRSTTIKSLDIGHLYDHVIEFYSAGEPRDLTAFTTISFVVFDSGLSTINAFTMTVLTADADKTADSAGTLVANKASVRLAPTGSAGDYEHHIVGIDGSAGVHKLAIRAKVSYFAGPPSS